MDNMNNTQELEEMRQQLNLLNQKLDKEKIINRQLIRKIMSSKITKLISTYHKLLLVLGILLIPLMVFLLLKVLDCSLLFVIVTALFLLIAVIYSWYIQRGISGSELINGNLLNVSCKLIRFRNLGNKWFFFSVPFIMIWIPWFFAQMLQQSEGLYPVIGGAIGGIVGGLMGFIYYRKTQRILKEVLAQIDELTSGE